ncbi:molybdenum cofactor guanylyltransferase [Micromonospora pisi]|uniref:molybdenum cofactor guanylyltransferase n=1 Tax=Micromonospora pisi TaxID=589240 RepID=UPI0024824B2B|nr:NTP transferase domain-containing protein [Micromonospora pisi]
MIELGAVVLTGGAARRMGGIDKPAVPVAGRSMRDRVLAAVASAKPRVVVGPAVDLPPGVSATREQPPGGGPVAATAAGLAALGVSGPATLAVPDPAHGPPGIRPEPPEFVALLAADLPLLTGEAVGLLAERLAGSHADGVLYRDDDGRRQLLCGVWRTAALAAALDRLHRQRGGTLVGASIRALVAELTVVEVSWAGSGPPPWFDCDTDDDVRRAEEWTR